MPIITDPDQLNDGTEITITTSSRTFTLNSGSGNLTDDGVTLQAIYSFFKEEWKDDPNVKSLMGFPFPMIAITPGKFEMIFDWEPANNATRKLIRTGGWREIDTENSGKLKRAYSNVITLGDFEDNANDLAYYQVGDDPTDTTAAIDFDFAGPVNEAILQYEENIGPDTGTGFDFGTDTITRNDAGDWIADGYKVGAQVTVLNANIAGNNGTFNITDVTASVITVANTPFTSDVADTTATFARNYRNSLNLFLRVRDADANGKTFDSSDLASIGETAIENNVFKFPLSNATDLKISETDANIDINSPYTEIRLRYLPVAYNREVDSTTKRNFGIVIDVGTYSRENGASNGTTLFTSADFQLGNGEALGDYTGGTLIIHEGTDQGQHTISGTPVDNAGTLEITLSSALSGTETDLSFTMERGTALTATAEEIYEKIQRNLREAADVDQTSSVVTGKTADELLEFVGDTLKTGTTIPENPQGGGSGVIIEGFDSNDTNRLVFTDNGGVEREFPFVAAGTIEANDNLVNDGGPAEFTMFFEYSIRTNVSDLALSGASGDTASMDSAGSNLPSLAQNDFIRLEGFANEVNNGIWQVTDATPSSTQADIQKWNGDTVVNEGAQAIDLDQDPIDSPDHIIVDDNSGTDIQGVVGSSSIAFDFDYDGNTQGGRAAGTDADIVIRAIGTDIATFVEATGTITRNTGLTFTLVSSLERNYSNP